jgi:hypothetical protein
MPLGPEPTPEEQALVERLSQEGKLIAHPPGWQPPPLIMESIDTRPSLRTRLYGRSRANRWPLWTSWLLAPSRDSRQRVRELMQIRKAGGDV